MIEERIRKLLEMVDNIDEDGGKDFFNELKKSKIYIYDLFSRLIYLEKPLLARKLIYVAILTGYLHENKNTSY